MTSTRHRLHIALIALVMGIVAVSALFLSATPGYSIVCECANDDSPVICSGGNIYPNMCVAHCFHAHGCKLL
ncbi:MAG TPA: hypothetical protein VE404_08870 [Verrucomicrobiae bacterium]|nr:hypothetical protein [Verrucomicrobiae bacterium]